MKKSKKKVDKIDQETLEQFAKEKNIDKNEVIKIEENSSQDSEFFEVTTDKDLFEKLKQYRIKKAKEEQLLLLFYTY